MSQDHFDDRPGLGFFIEVVLVALCVFVTALTIGLVTGAPWGTIPDWVGALSTLAAFCAAVIAAGYAARAFAMERRRDAERHSERREEQAARVGMWLEASLHQERVGNKISVASGTAVANIRNASELPVFDFTVSVLAVPQIDPQPMSVEMGSAEIVIAQHRLATLPPADAPQTVQVDLMDLARVLNEEADQKIYRTYDIVYSYEFSDASGVRWKRGRATALIETVLG